MPMQVTSPDCTCVWPASFIRAAGNFFFSVSNHSTNSFLLETLSTTFFIPCSFHSSTQAEFCLAAFSIAEIDACALWLAIFPRPIPKSVLQIINCLNSITINRFFRYLFLACLLLEVFPGFSGKNNLCVRIRYFHVIRFAYSVKYFLRYVACGFSQPLCVGEVLNTDFDSAVQEQHSYLWLFISFFGIFFCVDYSRSQNNLHCFFEVAFIGYVCVNFA